MDCRKAQSMITPFINNKLSLKELEGFIDHVNSCKNCKEELEVYYALLTAMKQLDEDKYITDDFNLELSEKLERAQEQILHAKFTYYRKKTVLILTIFFLAFLFGIRYANKEIDEDTKVTVSNFQIRRMYHETEFVELELLLQRYLKEQKPPLQE